MRAQFWHDCPPYLVGMIKHELGIPDNRSKWPLIACFSIGRLYLPDGDRDAEVNWVGP